MKKPQSQDVGGGVWAIRLPLADASSLATFRLTVDLQILIVGEWIWMKGESADEGLARRIRSVSNAEWFSIRDDGQITRRDETVPCDRLPEGQWTLIGQSFEIEMPQAGFAVSSHNRVSLTLVRCTQPQTVNLLKTNWSAWHDYAITAPLIRLNRLGFAVSDTREVLIRGTPLPPIPGRRYVESHGVIVPNGWRFAPQMGTEIVRQLLDLDAESLALFSEDGSYERLPLEAFVQATRASVRATNGA